MKNTNYNISVTAIGLEMCRDFHRNCAVRPMGPCRDQYARPMDPARRARARAARRAKAKARRRA